ncbi:MAG: hypothetical protein JXQ90_20120 [Cyclobacteriaceae bacterium]
MDHTFSLLFFLKKDNRITGTKSPIFLRITVNGKRVEQSVKRSIEHERWDTKAGRVKGNGAETLGNK